MSRVVADVAPLLKVAGFRKRRHTFNRSPEPGLVQVVNFQMGAFEPPGPGSEFHRTARESIGLAGNLYGRFTVNLGVYVAEMVLPGSDHRGGWVNHYDCQLRKRIGELLALRKDVWWSLDDFETAASTALDALQEAGIPWLDGLVSRDAILALYEAVGRRGLGMTPVGPVQIAWLLKDRDRKGAETVLRAYLEAPLAPGHRRRVEAWLREGGFAHLLGEERPPA